KDRLRTAQHFPQASRCSRGIPGNSEIWREVEPIGVVRHASDLQRGVVVSAERAGCKQLRRRTVQACDIRRRGESFYVVHWALNFPTQSEVQSDVLLNAPAILHKSAAHLRTGPSVILEAVVLERIGVDDLR